MGTITIIHHGLGLWINRGAHWEVLFPDASKWPNEDAAGALLHHDPVLFVSDASRANGKGAYDLRGAVLDLTSVSGGDATGSIAQPFMIGLQADPGAPADSVGDDTISPFVTGVMRLPPGLITPAWLPLVGPVKFGADTNRQLAFAIAWTALLINPPAPLAITLKRRGKVSTIQLTPDHAGNVLLYLQNLSVDDIYGVGGGANRTKDSDFAAHYLLTQTSPDVNAAVPELASHDQFMQDPSLTSHAAAVQSRFRFGPRISEDHLCSVAYLI